MQRLILIFISLTVLSCQTLDPKLEAYRQELQLHPLSILQGVTTETSTQISVLALENKNLSFKVTTGNGAELKATRHKKIQAGRTGYVLHQLWYEQLKKKGYYTLQVFENEQLKDQRQFQTFDLNQAAVRIGVASCLDDAFTKEQFGMWGNYLQLDPDVTFLIGDNVYSDYMYTEEQDLSEKAKAHEEMLWRRYVETWQSLLLYHSAELTPTLAIWDDHDYGKNDGGQNFAFKDLSLKILRSFYPLPEKSSTYTPLPGAGFVFEAFKQKFVFIDARSFRSAKNVTAKKQTQWGEKQTHKILNSLSTQTPTWLIQGDQFFGAYHRFESYEGERPESFKKTLKQISSKSAPVFFLSGDRHLTELMKIEKNILGYETYEFTTSAIHAKVYPNSWEKAPNPRQIQGVSGVRNFAILKSQAKGKTWNIEVEAYGPEMQLLYNENLKITKP